MKKHWVIEKENPRLREKLAKALGISPITAQVLINRGIKDEVEAEFFLKSSLFDIPSPFFLKGMDKAVERIKKAIERSEKIAIYGDYDVDGVTATALLYTFLRNIGTKVTYYNPHRLKEGYGINIEAIRKLKSEGVSLIVSGDCGITAWREVEEAKKLGIDFIVTDHHKPPQILPKAISVLNPHQPGCNYPGKEITGVGVIFNLTIALRRVLRESGFFKKTEPNLGDYLDLVALGTVADCASLVNVNRIFVKEGLKRLTRTKRPGIKALKEVSGIRGEVDVYDIGYKLGPRVNASGRLRNAGFAVELLISEDIDKAREVARILNQENTKRQLIEEKILKEAIGQVESSTNFAKSCSIVLASKNWHPGVIGIVASKMVEIYNKPTVLISIGEDGIGKGSGRSIEGLNIYEALTRCEDLFEQFGGHQLAAGLSIREERIEEFRDRFEYIVRESKIENVLKLRVDSMVNLECIDETIISELNLLSPFGIGNPEPVFLARSVDVLSQRFFKQKHLGLKVRQGNKIFDAIWFNLKEPISVPKKIDMVFTPEINTWNGEKRIRLRIIDLN
ncbi:MAG: single-stranded-DNA-specific exonuclease RecJ [Deltaproteobacteria bacterium]|nr:MAG: single-stranded-DNA-specific exonuclease RecJ [Deltaproteobacteria bacterium]